MRGSLILFAVLTASGSRAIAHPSTTASPDTEIPAPPPTYKGNDVRVEEHLGAKVSTDAPFRTQSGKAVTLGQVLAGDLPTILTFNYSDCPMLCSLQLNGLSTVLPQLGNLKLGSQFRIVTIDLEPNESLEKMAAMRDKYIARLPADQQSGARAGWTFLVAAAPGDRTQIRRVADGVGFSYTYIPERAEWAHPAALIFLAPSGAVTRYVYGIEFAVEMMRESIVKAGMAEPSTAVGFLNRCYHYDPDANSHAHAGVLVLRIGAAGCIVLLITGLGLLHFLRKKS